jgi:F-type H+-transporting ATPase subunit a
LVMHETEGIHIALKAEEIFSFFGIPVTNTMLMSWLVIIVLVAVAFSVGRNIQKIPGRLQTFFETLFSFLLDYIEEVLESRQLALRFFPLLATLFMFILLGNLFGLLPGIGSITYNPDALHEEVQASAEVHHEVTPGDPLFADNHKHGDEKEAAHDDTGHHGVSLFHPMSTDLNVTLALAIIAFVVIEAAGIAYLGFFNYMGKFFNFKSAIGFMVGIIELISELARLISFSFRLFGNMFAGKTLILVAMFFVPYIVPVPLMFYEVFVGLIQASIFTLLTLFFVKLAVSEAH